MIVGSVCSGILSDALAWAPLGWTHAWCAEIDPFASRVIAARHPGVQNLGDFTTIGEEHGPIDLLVGGTPCQSFSAAGLRAGLDDPRGNLALEFLALARRVAARWIVWENVPGVLSSGGGRDFGTFLGGLAELGYGFAYRVLDAQFFGLAQRRKRVFVVAHAGGAWQRAAAVLLERSGLCGDPPPSRGEGAEVAGALGAGASRGGGWRIGADEAAAGHIVGALKSTAGKSGPGVDGAAAGHVVPIQASTVHGGNSGRPLPLQEVGRPRDKRQNGLGIGDPGGPMYTVQTSHPHGVLQPLVFDQAQITHPENRARVEPGQAAPTLSQSSRTTVAFHQIQDPISSEECSPALGSKSSGMGVSDGWCVRRLTPRECERLMGLPDDYTAIDGASDAARYRAVGNGIAIPVLRWVGERIAMVEEIAA